MHSIARLFSYLKKHEPSKQGKQGSLGPLGLMRALRTKISLNPKPHKVLETLWGFAGAACCARYGI